MKRLIFTLSLILTLLSGYSQVTLSENNVVKLESLGWGSGYYAVRVTNKANCQTTIKVAITGWSTDSIMAANEVAIIKIPNMPTNITEIKAKRIAGASCLSGVSNEWVIVNVVQTVLPIKFKSIYVKRIDQKTARLEFESEEDNTIQRYIIKLSTDGKYWKDVLIIFPNGIQGSKKYSAIINL